MNFEVTKKGPLIPPTVNEKSFYSLTIPPKAEQQLKAGQVLKCTNGKVRVRNATEKAFTSANSQLVEKGDILAITGPVTAVNEDMNEGASFRIFTANKKK